MFFSNDWSLQETVYYNGSLKVLKKTIKTLAKLSRSDKSPWFAANKCIALLVLHRYWFKTVGCLFNWLWVYYSREQGYCSVPVLGGDKYIEYWMHVEIMCFCVGKAVLESVSNNLPAVVKINFLTRTNLQETLANQHWRANWTYKFVQYCRIPGTIWIRDILLYIQPMYLYFHSSFKRRL